MDSSQPPLSPEIAARIDSLAKQISVAEHLDAEIQAELRGHIEDKLRGYLSGEVRVSEGDAMLLAKAHFGDARAVKGMFQGVHATTHGASLMRRLVAFLLVVAAVSMLVEIADIMWTVVVIYPAAKVAEEQHSELFWLPQIFFAAFLVAISIALTWHALSIWRTKMNLGQTLWFEKWSGLKLLLVVMAAMACGAILSNIFSRTLIVLSDVRLVHARSALVSISLFLKYVEYAVDSLLCLWWCDRAPRTRRTLFYSAIGWLVAKQLLPGNSFWVIAIVHAAVSGISSHRIDLRPLAPTIGILGPWLGMNLAMDIGLGVVALLAYAAASSRRRAMLVG